MANHQKVSVIMLITEDVNGISYEYTPIGEWIVKAKGVCGGRPTFKYTRIEPMFVVNRFAAGESIDSIVESFGNRVPYEAVIEAIKLFGK